MSDVNREVFVTCTITGSGNSQGLSPHVPLTPKEIAHSAIEAANAGAAIVQCHVRNPETGAPSHRLEFYREVTERIRAANTDVVLNLPAQAGGDLMLGSAEAPLPVNDSGTDMLGMTRRLAHIRDCRPEISSLDCGSMNAGHADMVSVNTAATAEAMVRGVSELGVHPEITVHDTGHLWFARQLGKAGVLNARALLHLGFGTRWGAPDDLNVLLAMVNKLPADWVYSASATGQEQMQFVAASVLTGGNVRVGLGDSLMLSKGTYATNAQQVEKAVRMVRDLGAEVMVPNGVRDALGLVKRMPV